MAFLLCGGMMLPGCKNEKATGLNDMDVVAEKVKVGDSEVISCDLTKLKDTVDLPLSLFAEELQLVKLDNRDEALVGGGATFVSEHYILREFGIMFIKIRPSVWFVVWCIHK